MDSFLIVAHDFFVKKNRKNELLNNVLLKWRYYLLLLLLFGGYLFVLFFFNFIFKLDFVFKFTKKSCLSSIELFCFSAKYCLSC